MCFNEIDKNIYSPSGSEHNGMTIQQICFASAKGTAIFGKF
jgi:hypothetical protein